MKVITLKQPWASLVANGYKKIEFRSWKTNYRGKILIHAGVGVEKKEMTKFEHLNIEYPSRRIIAEVEILDCIEIDDKFNKKIKAENNIVYGSKDRTGFAWILGNVKKIDLDKEINGRLGFWNYEIDD